MNKNPIDIIIPWVNPNDKKWLNEFNYWKEKETGIKDACRYNDWGFIKYVLRSIEQNCPWCRYVFLVLSNESQIPSWLNINNLKLKIVYHRDYIPKEFLPTFNSNVIEMFYGNIKELSDNFILLNDDMFFWNKKDETFFFKNDKPVMNPTFKMVNNSNCWDTTLVNTLKLSNRLLGGSNNKLTYPNHLPCSYKKSLFQFINLKASNEIRNSFKSSKFRTKTNIMHYLVFDILYRMDKIVLNNKCRGQFVIIKNIDYNIDKNSPLVCLNEGELSTKYMIEKTLKKLNNKFPQKSGFEI